MDPVTVLSDARATFAKSLKYDVTEEMRVAINAAADEVTAARRVLADKILALDDLLIKSGITRVDR